MAWHDDDTQIDIEIDPQPARRRAAAPVIVQSPPPRHTGILRSWHASLRYGHIEPSDGSPEVFVHRSAFSGDAPTPAVGDALSFEVRSRDGRIQALRVRHEPRGSVTIAPRSGVRRTPRRAPHRDRNRLLSAGVAALLAIGVLWGVGGPDALGWRNGRDLASDLQTLEPTAAGRPSGADIAPAPWPVPVPAPIARPEPVLAIQPQVQPRAAAPSWRCDGRTTCSQMTSCAEASWFLANCPGVKMDGNRDGVPCEQQWCR